MIVLVKQLAGRRERRLQREHVGDAGALERRAVSIGREIEGDVEIMAGILPGDRVVVIEDLITSGGSIVKSVDAMRAEGLIIDDAIVLIDRIRIEIDESGDKISEVSK